MSNYKALTLAILLGFSSTAAYSSKLQTHTVTLQATPLEQMLDGMLEAIKQSTVSAEISGRVTEVNFDIDDIVNKGDVLLRVRDNEYDARLRKAEAAYSEAQAQFQDSKLEFDRAQDMFKKNAIAESQLDRASATLKAAEARVAASNAAITEAKVQLENTIVRAPYSGVVTKRHVEIGETVNPGNPLMTGLSLDELRATVDAPQSFIGAIRQHKKARVILLEKNQSIDSSSLTLFPYADPERHTFRIRIDLPKNTPDIYPGMLVKVAFLTDSTQRLMIPNNALVQRSEVNAVYVVDSSGKVKLRQVRTGNQTAEQTEILAGLDAGETIALDPVQAGITFKVQSGEKQ